MDNLKQALIENIADILDSEDVQREEILNGFSDPEPREESDLHIRMAEAAFDVYKKTCEGQKTDTSKSNCNIPLVRQQCELLVCDHKYTAIYEGYEISYLECLKCGKTKAY